VGREGRGRGGEGRGKEGTGRGGERIRGRGRDPTPSRLTQSIFLDTPWPVPPACAAHTSRTLSLRLCMFRQRSGKRLCNRPCLCVCVCVFVPLRLSDCNYQQKSTDFTKTWTLLGDSTNGKNRQTFGDDPIPHTDSASSFHFPHHCRIRHF